MRGRFTRRSSPPSSVASACRPSASLFSPLTKADNKPWLGLTSTTGSPLFLLSSRSAHSLSLFLSLAALALPSAFSLSASLRSRSRSSASRRRCSARLRRGWRVRLRYSAWTCLDVMGRGTSGGSGVARARARAASAAARDSRPCMPRGLGTTVKVLCREGGGGIPSGFGQGWEGRGQMPHLPGTGCTVFVVVVSVGYRRNGVGGSAESTCATVAEK